MQSILKTFRRTIQLILDSKSLKACLVMVAGLCFHFFGYECARAVSIILLTEKVIFSHPLADHVMPFYANSHSMQDVGLGNEAYPLTIIIGSILSGIVLYWYTAAYKMFGAKNTLRGSFAICIIIFGATIVSIGEMNGLSRKITVVVFYAFREMYVSLLASQQWAFISGLLDPSTASLIVLFTGLESVASALGGFAVEHLATVGGVRGLLLTTTVTTALSCACAEAAHSFVRNPPHTKHSEPSKTSMVASNSAGRAGFWSDSWRLLRDYPILQALLVNGLLHQTCSNLLNIMFHNGLRTETANSEDRAKIVGRFFAAINIASCVLQCVVIPYVLKPRTLPRMLVTVPLLVLGTACMGVAAPGFGWVVASFGTLKVLEYSVLSPAGQMIYMPLGAEARYLGKELVRYVVKLGRSGSSLLLGALVAHCAPSLGQQSMWVAAIALGWTGVARGLATALETHVRVGEVLLVDKVVEANGNTSQQENKIHRRRQR